MLPFEGALEKHLEADEECSHLNRRGHLSVQSFTESLSYLREESCV